MYRSILVPLDGSTYAEHALPFALTIARGAKSALHLASVHVPLAELYAETRFHVESGSDELVKAQERQYLDGIAERVRDSLGRPVESAMLEGQAADTLLRRAHAIKADLIVMTTHGRGPLGRLWLGSVADSIVRASDIPVLLVRSHELPLDLKSDIALKRIAIALDGSPLAEKAIEPAIELGSLLGADFLLLRIISPLLYGPIYPEQAMSPVYDQTAFEQLKALHLNDRARSQRYLDDIAMTVRDRQLKVEMRVSDHPYPATGILEELRTQRADGVALATHGLGGLKRLFLGSVADKVIRGVTIPVLAFRPGAA